MQDGESSGQVAKGRVSLPQKSKLEKLRREPGLLVGWPERRWGTTTLRELFRLQSFKALEKELSSYATATRLDKVINRLRMAREELWHST